MSKLVFFILITLCVAYVQSDGCRYEFFVPNIDGIQCSGDAHGIEQKVNVLESSLNASDRQLKSFEDALSMLRTKVDDDTVQFASRSTEMETKLYKLQASLESLQMIRDEVDRIEKWILHTNESMGPKFDSLQTVVTDFMLHVQKQMSEQLRIYGTVQARVNDQDGILREHSGKIKNISEISDRITDLNEKINTVSDENNKQDSILDSLNRRMKMVETSIDGIQGMLKSFHTAQLSLKQTTIELTGKTDRVANFVRSIQDRVTSHGLLLVNNTQKMKGFESELSNLRPLSERVDKMEESYEQERYNLTQIEKTAEAINDAFASKAEIYMNTMNSMSSKIWTEVHSIQDRLQILDNEVSKINAGRNA